MQLNFQKSSNLWTPVLDESEEMVVRMIVVVVEREAEKVMIQTALEILMKHQENQDVRDNFLYVCGHRMRQRSFVTSCETANNSRQKNAKNVLPI